MRRLGIVMAAAGLAGAAPAIAAPAQLFAERCALCHQSSGAGLPGQFPRLAGRASTIAATRPGRRYLALVLLNGMVGTINVDGQAISGLMPSMAALPDQSIADLLNHVLQLGPPAKGKKPVPFTAAEIAGVRKEAVGGASGVAGERTKLVSAGVIP